MAVSINFFVVDASFILSFLLPDEKVAETDRIFEKFQKRQIGFLSTKLLPFEVSNSLKLAYIRKRISKSQAKDLMDVFLDYEIKLKDIDLRQTFDLSLKKDLTFYDASYLYLSKSNNLSLLTLDKKLKSLS